MTTPDAPPPTEQGIIPASPPWRRPMPTWAAMTFATLVVAGLVLLFAFVINPATDSSRQPIKACEAWVLDQLVSPASARFSNEQWFDTDNPEVFGDVDSQNSFGALLRTHFVCSMARQDGAWVVADGSAF